MRKHTKIYLIVIFLLTFGCAKEESKEINTPSKKYSFAIDTKEWCYKRPQSSGLLGYLVTLNQILDDKAIFKGEGLTIVLPLSQLNEEPYRGMPIAEAARYIGKVGTIKLRDSHGFPVDVELYTPITSVQFRAAEKKKNGSNECKAFS